MSREQVDIKLSRRIDSFHGSEDQPLLVSEEKADIESNDDDFPLMPLKNKKHKKYALIGLYIVILVLISGYFIPHGSNPESESEQKKVKPLAKPLTFPPGEVKVAGKDANNQNADQYAASINEVTYKYEGATSDGKEYENKNHDIRLPRKYKKYSTNFLQHEIFKDTSKINSDIAAHAKNICFGVGHFDVFVNEEAVKNDMLSSDSFTALSLDCRDEHGKTLMGFIAIVDNHGDIKNARLVKKRAEGLSMKDSKTVLYTTQGEAGTYIWDWTTGSHDKLPFDFDPHCVQFSSTSETFYGIQLRVKDFPARTAVGYNVDGEANFQYTLPADEYGDINKISVDDQYMYISVNDHLRKVSLRTGEEVAVIGGTCSSYSFVDQDGNSATMPYTDASDFHYIGRNMYALYDHNELDSGSRLVVLRSQVSNEQQTITPIFEYDLGEHSGYGRLDIMPSGNVFGISYPLSVNLNDIDERYSANMWEITPEGAVAWRFGLQGPNPWGPSDGEPFSHTVSESKPDPIGWVIVDAEKFNDVPTTTQVCYTIDDKGYDSVRAFAFNSVLTSEDMPALSFLFDEEENEMIGKTVFDLSRSRLPEMVEFRIPQDSLAHKIQFVLVNGWKETFVHEIDDIMNLPSCDWMTEKIHHQRAFT